MSGIVVRERSSVLANWNEARPPLAAATELLAVNPDYEEMVFGCFDDARANRLLLQSEQSSFSVMLDGVEVHFYAGHAEATVHDGRPALRMRIPAQVLRMQRREYYRVPAALNCDLVVRRGGGTHTLQVAVTDLSLGGLRFVAGRDQLDTAPGELLEGCRLHLDGETAIEILLEVRNVSAFTASGAARQRIGCRFVGMTPELERLLDRFIAGLQHAYRH